MTSDEQMSMFGEAPVQQNSAKPVSFSITKTINAGAQKVFDQWLIPVFIGEWMFDPEIVGERVISLDNTVRKGGSFNFTVEKAGKQIEYSGDYLELRMPSALQFSWNKNGRDDRRSEITVSFEEDQGKTRTRLVMKLDPALAEHKDQVKEVWTARLAALAGRFK